MRHLHVVEISEEWTEEFTEAFHDANFGTEIANKTELLKLEYRLIIKQGAIIIVTISTATVVKIL